MYSMNLFRNSPFRIKSLQFNNKYRVSLFSLYNDFNKDQNLLIHHGMMGSSRNFRSLSKNPSIANYANSFLIDCRNHGSSIHTETHTI